MLKQVLNKNTTATLQSRKNLFISISLPPGMDMFLAFKMSTGGASCHLKLYEQQAFWSSSWISAS